MCIHLRTCTCTPSRKLEWTLFEYAHDRASMIVAAGRLVFPLKKLLLLMDTRYRDEHCCSFRQYNFPFVYPILLGSVTTVAECVLDQSSTVRFPPI